MAMIEIPEDVLLDALLTYTSMSRQEATILVADIKGAAEAAENERLEHEPREPRREDQYPYSLYYRAGG